MPPVAAALATAEGISAAISGGSAIAGSVIGSRSQSGANKRAIEASRQAATRAEAFEREQDRLNREDQSRRDAEDQRRYEVDQANIARRQAQEDAILKDTLARQQYDDEIRYGKMLRIAELTGQAPPPRPPARTAVSALESPNPTLRQLSEPVASRPAQSNAMIARPGASFDPFDSGGLSQGMPVSALSSRDPRAPLDPFGSDRRMPIRALTSRRY